jgi:peptide/nickel transport system substrate-binding protein
MRGFRCRLGCMIVMLGCLLVALPLGWTQQPTPGGTLRVAWEADITGLDPYVSSGVQSQIMVGSLFNSLLTIDTNLNYVPDLAESWEVLENGKVYVFHLRKGVTFHEGSAFDAEVVRWNYRRIMDPEEKTFVAPYFSVVERVEAVDAHTVKFTLKHPSATLLPAIAVARVGFLQMSPASYQRWGKDEVRMHPDGTGPFRLAKWEQNQLILLEKHAHYFKPGLPYLDRIEFRIMKEGVTRATALRAGEVDFANYVPREHVERLSRDPKITVLRGRDTQRVASYFNLSRKPFDDVRVRRAILGYGIDRQAIVKTALLGLAQPLWSFVPPGAKDHLDFGEQFPYNPEKAKALLKEAGFDDKNPLRYTITTHAAEPALPTIATIMKTQLAQIGVEVTVEVIDRPVFLRRLTKDRDWDQFINFSGAAEDTYTASRVLDTRAGNNNANHQDTHVDALIDRIREAPTEEAYRQAGHDLQRYIVDNMMFPSVATLPLFQAHRRHVKGYEPLHGFKMRFETTWLEKP